MASEQPMLTETQIVSEHPQERRLTLSEWADALEKRASTYAVDDCGWSAEAARFDRALAARLREADEALVAAERVLCGWEHVEDSAEERDALAKVRRALTGGGHE